MPENGARFESNRAPVSCALPSFCASARDPGFGARTNHATIGKMRRDWHGPTMSRLISLLALVLLASCSIPLTPKPPEMPAPPTGLKAVAVAEPRNATGADLAVNESGFLAGFLDDRKTTSVPELLGEKLRVELGRRDFRLVPPDSGAAPVLRTDIRRWQPQSATWEQVTVDLGASLVEPGTGRVLWSVEQNGWIVPTEGAHNSIDASIKASHRIAETLTEGWTVPPPPERPIAP
jgi:hypothetical protein